MLVLLAACSPGKAPLADELDRYTDKGDGCQQVVSAIAYADEALKPAGQERYQVFDDEVAAARYRSVIERWTAVAAFEHAN